MAYAQAPHQPSTWPKAIGITLLVFAVAGLVMHSCAGLLVPLTDHDPQLGLQRGARLFGLLVPLAGRGVQLGLRRGSRLFGLLVPFTGHGVQLGLRRGSRLFGLLGG